MRSESRNGIAESGRRSSKNVKLRAVKPAGAASLTDTACGSQSASSALYSHQLWQASGHLPQRLSCSRTLYYPELAVAAPVLKFVPDESVLECQHKRPKLGSGQYRRCRDAASDSTPPSTPYNKPANKHSTTAVEDRVGPAAGTSSSSSSSHDLNIAPRQSVCSGWEDLDVVWPLPSPTRRRRSIRRRRANWLQLPLVLHGVCIQGSDDAGGDVTAAAGGHHDIAAAAAVAAAFAPSLPQQTCNIGLAAAVALTQDVELQQQGPQEQAVPLSQVPDVVAAELPQLPQQQVLSSAQLQQDGCTNVEGQLCHIDQAEHSTVVVVAGAQAPVTVGKEAAEANSAQETSQSSDMTCMQEDSPRGSGSGAAVLASWPSSSTDSDCRQQQKQQQESKKLHTLPAADDRHAAGGLDSPESPSFLTPIST